MLTGSQKEKYKSPSYQIREGDCVNIAVTSPGATLALGMMYFNTGNRWVLVLLLFKSLWNHRPLRCIIAARIIKCINGSQNIEEFKCRMVSWSCFGNLNGNRFNATILLPPTLETCFFSVCLSKFASHQLLNYKPLATMIQLAAIQRRVKSPLRWVQFYLTKMKDWLWLAVPSSSSWLQ